MKHEQTRAYASDFSTKSPIFTPQLRTHTCVLTLSCDDAHTPSLSTLRPPSCHLQVAPFLGKGSAPGWSNALDAEAPFGCLMPPEMLCAKPIGIAKLLPSPTRSRIERRHGGREAADVWGIGTLAFELATGRVAGKNIVYNAACGPYYSAVL